MILNLDLYATHSKAYLNNGKGYRSEVQVKCSRILETAHLRFSKGTGNLKKERKKKHMISREQGASVVK